jgi:hypothetical protein
MLVMKLNRVLLYAPGADSLPKIYGVPFFLEY